VRRGLTGLALAQDPAQSRVRKKAVDFKEALEKLACRLGLDIRIAHYPPYCSKHNPIEHRLFAHVTRACQGVVFHSMAIARQFMALAKTTTGLKISDDVLNGVYVTGKTGQLHLQFPPLSSVFRLLDSRQIQTFFR